MMNIKMKKIDIPKKPGIYTIVIEVVKHIRTKIGKIGDHYFPKGIYTYTGSAVGLKTSNLRTRVSRHLDSEKRMHWHIDYLLCSEPASVRAVIFLETYLKIECEIAKKIGKINGGNIAVNGFGSSDCHEGCKSHLHQFDTNLEELLIKIREVYKTFGFPKTIHIEYDSSI
jgi:Uri superfamily endonuclease